MMGFEKNIWFGVVLILIGVVLILSTGFYDLSFTVAGPKIVLIPMFVIIGVLIVYNWYKSQK